MAVSEAQQEGEVRRWLGYTCPECHAIFRVPLEGQGKVAECPNCLLPVLLGRKGALDGAVDVDQMSADVPSADDDVPEGWERSERSGRLKRKKMVTKKRKLEQPGWEDEGLTGNQRQEGARFFVVLLAGLLFLTAGVGVFLKRLVEAQEMRAEVVEMGELPVPGVEEDEKPPELLEDGFELNEITEAISELVATFLEAREVEALLPLIRSRERVEPLMRAYHARHGFEPLSYREIAPDGRLQMKGSLFSVMVIEEDFSRRPIALEETAEGMRVDWESWVGYGELSWAELTSQRPINPILMRVSISALSYYNFEFSDDTRWRSYRIAGPGEEDLLYGYVRVGSPEERKLSLIRTGAGAMAMTVRLRYPPDATRGDQAIIDEVLTSGWVLLD